jgi:hypothetical protein
MTRVHCNRDRAAHGIFSIFEVQGHEDRYVTVSSLGPSRSQLAQAQVIYVYNCPRITIASDAIIFNAPLEFAHDYCAATVRKTLLYLLQLVIAMQYASNGHHLTHLVLNEVSTLSVVTVLSDVFSDSLGFVLD